MIKSKEDIFVKNAEVQTLEILSTLVHTKKYYNKPKFTVLGNMIRITLGGSGGEGDMFSPTVSKL